jgi:LysR family cys regulon transcriptional activator
MNLQQLRCITAIAANHLNVSLAAKRLFTSQPGVSRLVRMLEDELGVLIFERAGKQLTAITPAGERIIEYARAALADVESIREAAKEFADPGKGRLGIATTHTQARYILPPVISAFAKKYPGVDLHLHQGNPQLVAEFAARGEADFAIATEAMEHFQNLVMMPVYRWNRVLIVPAGHPLLKQKPLTLEAVAQYPLLTYTFGFTGRSKVDESFAARGLKPRVVFTAADADVIKTYVRSGMGVGLIGRMAIDSRVDGDLKVLDVGHLIEPSVTWIGFRRGLHLRGFHYDFIQIFGPHLTRELVDKAARLRDAADRERLFRDIPLKLIGSS